MSSTISESVMAQPAAAPRGVRERRWGIGGLGGTVALIVIGALGMAALVYSAQGGTSYVALAKPVAFGQQITADDLTSVRVSTGAGLQPVAANDISTVVGKFATVSLVPGALLSKAQFTGEAIPGKGKQVLSVPLKSEQAPAFPLEPGVPVLLVRTQDTSPATAGSTAAQPTPVAGTVRAVRELAYGGGVVVDVIVSAVDGPTIAGAASAGRVAILLTEGSAR